MRNLKKNEKTIYGTNYLGKRDIIVDGHKTGESHIVYSEIYEFKANVSGARGNAIVETIGMNLEYDKVMVISTATLEALHINENTVFFIDKKPEYGKDNNPLYDYRVKRICDAINEVAITLEKVREK